MPAFAGCSHLDEQRQGGCLVASGRLGVHRPLIGVRRQGLDDVTVGGAPNEARNVVDLILVGADRSGSDALALDWRPAIVFHFQGEDHMDEVRRHAHQSLHSKPHLRHTAATLASASRTNTEAIMARISHYSMAAAPRYRTSWTAKTRRSSPTSAASATCRHSAAPYLQSRHHGVAEPIGRPVAHHREDPD